MIVRIPSEETTANSYVIEEDHAVLLVDASDAGKLLSLSELQRWKPERILLTHEHVDHIAGLEQIRSCFAVPVTASESCSAGIQNIRRNLSTVQDLLIYACTGVVPQERHRPFTCRPCETTFDNFLSFSWCGHHFRMISCPGHSPGSSLLLMDDTAAFTGDYFLPDAEVNLTLPGGNREDYRAVTLPLLQHTLTEGMMIFPGHGEPYVFSGQISQ